MPVAGPPIAWPTVEDAIHDGWLVPATGIDGTSIIWYGQGSGRPVTPFVELKWGFVERVGVDGVTVLANPLTFAPVAFTASTGQPLSAPAHGLALGDGPVQLTGAAPAPLALATNYWAIPVDADHLNLASSFLNARSGVPIAVTGSGSGTIVAVDDTVRAGAEILRAAQGVRRVILDVTCFGTSGIGSQGADQILDAAVAFQPLIHSTLNAAGLSVLKFGRVQSTDGVIDSTVFEPRAILEVTLMMTSQVAIPWTIIAEVMGTGPNGTFDSGRFGDS